MSFNHYHQSELTALRQLGRRFSERSPALLVERDSPMQSKPIDEVSCGVCIKGIGLSVRDIYDFLNIGDDQLLGYGSEENAVHPGPIDYFAEPDHVDKADKRYFKVNGAFARYRKQHQKGGDFMIFSTVTLYPVSIRVHLNSVDFQEFADRSKG